MRHLLSTQTTLDPIIMSATKVLWGQIFVVFAIVLVTMWAATQWVAWELGYQPQLGQPWFELTSGVPIYFPPAFFWWWYAYDAYAPQVFVEGEYVASSGGLSRNVLAGAAAVGSAAIFGATFWALQNNRSHTSAPSEIYTTDHHNVADGLAGLPRDYAGAPRQVPPLGPPLPGDLGRPILNAQNGPSAGIPANDSEQQRLDQEIEAARLSRLFASTSIREVASSIAQVASVGASTIAPNQMSQPAHPGADDTFTQNGQDRKLAFVNASVDTRTTSPDRVAAPLQPMSCRLAISFRRHLSQAFARICPARSRPRSPKASSTARPVVSSSYRKERA
jgi:hypothetical protein